MEFWDFDVLHCWILELMDVCPSDFWALYDGVCEGGGRGSNILPLHTRAQVTFLILEHLSDGRVQVEDDWPPNEVSR